MAYRTAQSYSYLLFFIVISFETSLCSNSYLTALLKTPHNTPLSRTLLQQRLHQNAHTPFPLETYQKQPYTNKSIPEQKKLSQPPQKTSVRDIVLKGPLKRTPHGIQRALQRNFSKQELKEMTRLAVIKEQNNGRFAFVTKTDNQTFNVIIVNSNNMLITCLKGLSQADVNNIAKKYDWKDVEK